MQVSIEQTGALERRMEVSVPKERVEKAVDERLQKVRRTARLKGFRPGTAPIKVIRQQFGAQVRQEVLSELLQSSFAEAVTQQKLTPAAGPQIEPIAMGPGQDLKYRAIFEVFPDVALKSVDGLVVARPAAESAPMRPPPSLSVGDMSKPPVTSGDASSIAVRTSSRWA